ncbi:retrovirus-related pol polyprotein from transposon TNT 1-94 [Tanacetum coccineum]
MPSHLPCPAHQRHWPNIWVLLKRLGWKREKRDVFYIVTDSALSASRFHDLSTAYNVAMILLLLLDVNLQLKQQHLQKLVNNLKSKSPRDVPEFDFLNLEKSELICRTIVETSTHNTPPQVEHQKINSTNAPGIPSTGVKGASAASRSKPRSNTKKDRTLPARSALKQVEAHSRMNKSNEKQENHVDSSISFKRTVINSNSNSLCKTCNECLISSNHVKCVERFLKSYNKTPVKQIWRVKQVKQTWKPTGKIFTTIGYHWKPTGRIFPLGDQCPLTRITKPKALPVKQWKPTGRLIPLDGQCPLVRPPAPTNSPNPVASNLVYSNQMDLNYNRGSSISNSPFSPLFKCRLYRSFSGSRGTNLYTISVDDMMRSSPICLLSKASKNKSWLWHRRLNHLNFGMLNDLARKDLVRGLPRLKFKKDHLCFACQLGKSRKATHKPKTINTIMEVHMGEVFEIQGRDSCLRNQPVKTTSSRPQQNCQLTGQTAPVHSSSGPVPNLLTPGPITPEPNSEASSSRTITITTPNQSTQPHEHLRKWTDSHTLDNMIRNPSQPVFTRKQLATDALWCFYNSVLSKVEPKNFKSAVTKDCWFQAMQDEIHEFDRLDV